MQNWRDKLKNFFQYSYVNAILALLILANIATLGLETSHQHMSEYGFYIRFYNDAMLIIFSIEILGRMVADGRSFFRNGWHVFDCIVLFLAALTLGGSIQALRIIRVFWLIRNLSISKHFKNLFDALEMALPKVFVISSMLLLAIYVFALIGTIEFGQKSHEFSSLPESMATLAKTVLMEHTWADLYRILDRVHPHAWAFVFPVMIILNFLLLHLVLGILVNSLHQTYEEEENATPPGFIGKFINKSLKKGSNNKTRTLNPDEEELLQIVELFKKVLEKRSQFPEKK